MWETKTLDQVCFIVGGGTPSKQNKSFYNGEIPWATVRDMNVETIKQTEHLITQEAVQRSSTNLIPANNVIIASRVGLGKVCILENDTAINQDLRAIIPKSKNQIEIRYLFRWLQSIEDKIKSAGRGMTVKGVTLPFIKSLPIPLPTLPEQKRIVAILDEAFEGIDAAISNTQANLAAARELFESYLHVVFGSSSQWSEETTVGEQLLLQRGFDITKKQQRPGTIPVVSSGGIKSYHDECKAKGPGVVIGRKGSLGTAHFVEGDYWPHDTTLWVKDFKSNSPKIVYYFFKSFDVSGLDSGAANPALNRNIVHPIKTYWPKHDLQAALLEKLELLEHATENLQDIYRKKLDALYELKQSILAKAFRGELTQEEIAA